jgi:glycolate oxidase iron-sulfur subunit
MDGSSLLNATKLLDTCIHCGLCLNACPTYRQLGLEMDSPRGRIYQMVKVAEGEMQMGESYVQHLDLCLACRGCETACPSGVQYGRLVEKARADIAAKVKRPWLEQKLRNFVYGPLLATPWMLKVAGAGMYLYQLSGLQAILRATGWIPLAELAPDVEVPFFFEKIGKTYPAEGERRYRVALLAGCIQNIFFARLQEATVRVLRKNGCEVVIPAGQGCCGALHVHAGEHARAQELARINVAACIHGNYDAIITNTAGCGSTLKEYDELLGHTEEAKRFVSLMRDVNEFLAGIELNPRMGALPYTVTYQDSCHLAHGQKIKAAPRKLLGAIPGITFKEAPLADLCCGSAGVYNVAESEMAAAILASKMPGFNETGANVIATANPGCMLQLRAGVRRHGRKQRVAHVVELLDEAYRGYQE